VSSPHIGNRYLRPEQLKVRQTYLMISFFDDELQIPDITTVIYLGKDIFRESVDHHYFQEYSSYLESGGRHEGAVIVASSDKLMNFFDLDGASKLLDLCARRQGER
jgi:hypothetical protein